MYNSKELVVDPELTFLSYNQTINAEFTLEEILDSPLWIVNSDNGLIKAIPLFNCDKITSSNSSDKVLDSNKCVILENDMDTIVKCISDDTGSMHYHSVELYAYAPYSRLDVISEVTVYCILHDEYLNTVGNVNVDVYIDDELSGSVVSDSNGVCRFKVDQPCTVKFVYGELESNIVVIDEPQIYTLSIETDKSSLFTDESVTVTGVLMVDGEVYADQSIALYDGLSLIDTVVTDSNGEYTKTVSGLSVGAHVFRAVHAHVRSISVSVTVNAHSYSLSIVSDKQSILTSESVTISGVLLKDSGAFTGQSVDLYDGVTKIATLTTDGTGEYEETVSGLSVGVHTFKAVHSNVESSTISITVNEPTHTYSLSIASDKQSILTTESVTLSGQLLMDSSPYTGQSVSLYDGVTLVATLTTDSNGEYEETVSGLSVGTHTFKAVTSNAESSTVTVTVNKITTTTSISASSSSILTTDTLVLTGSVSNASTGSVKIYDGSTLVDEVSLSSGTYNKSLTGLSVGTHTYKAVYDGDSTHSGSESSTVSVTVTEPAPVHDYSLSVVSDKDIISYADGESATLTATLKDNGVVVSGETLSYEIKHGSTILDSGTDVTDSNGQISITYTGTGAGDIDVIVSYGSLLQETYEVTDYIRYDDATTDKTSNYQYNNLNSHTFSTDKYIAQRTIGTSSASTYYSPIYPSDTLPTNYQISVDIFAPTKEQDKQFGLCVSNEYTQTYSGTNQCFLYANTNRMALGYRLNGSLTNYGESSTYNANTWYTFKITVNGTSVSSQILNGDTVVQSWSGTLSNLQYWKKIMIITGGQANSIYWKNLKIKAL